MNPIHHRFSIRGLRLNTFLLLSATPVGVWLALLLLGAGVHISSLLFLAVEAAVMMSLILYLTEHDRRRITALLFLSGLVLFTVEILLIQASPYGDIVPSDSVRYDLNAQALAAHWQGSEVSAKEFLLQGLLSRDRMEWLPSDWIPYTAVFGSRHYLYQVYVGVIYFLAGPQQVTVLLSHAILAAVLAPSVYGTCSLIFSDNRIATLAAFITLIDSSFAAVGSFFLKDLLVAVATVIALWTTVICLRRPASLYPALILVGTLLCLSVLRYHALIAFWLASVVVMNCGS